MTSCTCQPRVAMIRNPIRGLSAGSFERTGDFGRGTFERTDDFGGFFGSVLGGIGQAFKFALPIAAPLLGGLAQQAVFGKPAAQAGTQQSGNQSQLFLANAEAEAAKAKADADAKLRQTYVLVGGLVVGAVAVYLITRRKRR